MPAPVLEVAQIRPFDKLDLHAVGITDNADAADPVPAGFGVPGSADTL